MMADVEKLLPEDYRRSIREYLGHDFFDTHANRTNEYAERLNFRGKKVLEVGGFPGLLVAMYLINQNIVETIESPKFRTEAYLGWLDSKGITHHQHDLTAGAPPISVEYDIGVMSDVMLHIDGFPFDFWKWFLKSCKTVYLANYPNGAATLVNATRHNLHEGFALPSHDEIIAFSSDISELKERFVCGGREFLVFERKS